MLTEKQLEARRNGIGGSDVAPILGISPWRSAIDVYIDKTSDTINNNTSEAMEWGSRLEPLIVQHFQDITGITITTTDKTFTHPEHKFMLANVDGIIDDDTIFEAKTASRPDDWGVEGTDEVPIYYITQIQHYMAVMNAQRCHLAVLINGNKFKTYVVERDDEIMNMLIEREQEFWQLVINRTPPEINSISDWKSLSCKAKANNEAAEASPDILMKIDALKSINQHIKIINEQKEQLTVDVLKYMKSNSQLTHAGNVIANVIHKKYTGWDFDRLKSCPDIAKQFKTKEVVTNYLNIKD